MAKIHGSQRRRAQAARSFLRRARQDHRTSQHFERSLCWACQHEYLHLVGRATRTPETRQHRMLRYAGQASLYMWMDERIGQR